MAQRFSKIFAVTGAVLTCVSIPSYASFNGLTEQDEFNIKLRSIYFTRKVAIKKYNFKLCKTLNNYCNVYNTQIPSFIAR